MSPVEGVGYGLPWDAMGLDGRYCGYIGTERDRRGRLGRP